MKIDLALPLSKAALVAIFVIGISVSALRAATPTATVDPATHAAHVAAGTMPAEAPAAGIGDPALSQQISDLQAKVAQLEAALGKSTPPMAAAPAGAAMAGMPAAPPTASPPLSVGMEKMKPRGQMGSMAPAGGMPAMSATATPAPPMAGMSGAGGGMNMMEMMDKMMSMEGGAMPGGGAPMAPMGGSAVPAPPAAGGGMGMRGKGKMGMAGMMGMAPVSGGASGAMSQSALPGFPGASHLYHIGATDFFLDHPQHITLSTEQTAALNKAKEQAMLGKSTADRAIEQELWMLTASDQPDAVKIEPKIRQIEKLTGDARLAFVRAIGEASKLRTDDQRKILTGFAAPEPAMPAASMATPMAPMKGT